MIAKAGHLEPKVITAARDKSRQNPNTVPELIRIAGLMNIGFNTGAVGADSTALFDIFFFGITQYVTVDHLPGISADGLYIAVQGRLFETLIGKPDATKPTQAVRIDDVKGQLFIRKTEKNFDHDTAQYLVSAHPFGTGTLGLRLSSVQVLQNATTDDRVFINDAADHFQLLALRVIKDVGHEGHLFLPVFAHFVTASFFVFVVLLVVCMLSIYYIKQRNATTKCAFFMHYN
jgi:hypothetical protein